MLLFMKRLNSSYSYPRIVNIFKLHKLENKIGVKGWIKNIRRLKNNIFLDINDGSTCSKFQVVVPKNDDTKPISVNSIVRATGTLQIAPNGSYELHAENVETLADGQLTKGYPFSPKQKHAADYVRQYLHLRSRVDSVAALMRLRHRAQKLIHDFMDENGFVQINTPILTTNDCEGAGEVFKVQPDSSEVLKQMSRKNSPLDESYFDCKAFLSVSGQLHLEAMTYGLGNTYTFAPAFRAENSKSPLHLSEFYMLEVELAFMEDLNCLVHFMQHMLKNITRRLLDVSESDINFCQKCALGDKFEIPWLDIEWPTLSYDEAITIIASNSHHFKSAVNPQEGFSKEQELFLVRHCEAPVFITDWPAIQKPFYMKVSPSNPKIAYAVDLLMPNVGELCGGSLRENDIGRLENNTQLPKSIDWYIELRKFGGIPTGGFGMGFERYLQLLTGIKNIRDVIPFPRYPHSCKL